MKKFLRFLGELGKLASRLRSFYSRIEPTLPFIHVAAWVALAAELVVLGAPTIILVSSRLYLLFSVRSGLLSVRGWLCSVLQRLFSYQADSRFYFRCVSVFHSV